MSRCYPFPPPGYAGKCSSHEALILSIKLQKEREKAISDKEGNKCISDREREKLQSSNKKKDKESRNKEKKDQEGKNKEEKREKRDKEDKKKDKKDKEERRREKREKRDKKAKASVELSKKDAADKLSKTENLLVESKGKLLGSYAEAELLERSSLTEEHGQPIDSQHGACSSDSTSNSSKRKRCSPSPSGIQSNGNIIRIRLSTSQKRDEPSTSGSKEQSCLLPPGRNNFVTSHSQVQPCVAHVRPVSSSKQKNVIPNGQSSARSGSTSTATVQLFPTDVSRLKEKTIEPVFRNEKLSSHDTARVRPESSTKQKDVVSNGQSFVRSGSTSTATEQHKAIDVSLSKGKTIELVSHDKIQCREPLEKLSSHHRKMKKMETMYNNLFMDWVPASLENVVDENDDDEDWLFGKKDEDRAAKRLRVNDIGSCSGDTLPCSASAVMQPRAQYLADVQIYALPFTVPF